MSQELFGLRARSRPLLGYVCAVPTINGRSRWWMTVVDQSECGKFIRVSAGVRSRKARWVRVTDVTELRLVR